MNESPEKKSSAEETRRRPLHRVGRLIRPLLWALAITLALFLSYEIIEKLWLTQVEMSTLHLLHMLRGIFSSLLVAGVVAWMIIKTSPGFLPEQPLNPEWETPQQRASEAERSNTYARWFIGMRWIAVLLAGILVSLSVRVAEWLPGEVWWPLVLTVTVLAIFNLGYTLLVQRGAQLPGLLPLQAYVDLLILTTLLHFSGGIENPLSLMMIFHVIIGGILLSRRQCYWIAAAASGLFALLAWAEWADVVEHYTLQLFPHMPEQGGELFHPAHHTLYVVSWAVLQTAVLFLTAYFVTTLSERLRRNEQQLLAMADRAMADQQLLERALETTGTGLRVVRGDLGPYWSSKLWNDWFVCLKDEVCPGCQVLHEEGSPAAECLTDARVRVTELVLEAENCPPRLLQAGETQRIFQVTTAPLLDKDGKTAQVVELAQDITEQKKTQARILHAGKLAAVGELAGQIAHEVNNPISIISAKASLLLADHRQEMSPKIAQELGKITDLANRVARIAQGLLSYCRPSAATRVRLDLRVPVRKSLAAVDEQARRGGVRIDDELPDPLPLVKANPQEMEQVFLNLFLNALDAMPKGGWLSVSAPPEPVFLPDGRPAVAVVVSDTGCGIPEEIREKVFEPFFTTKHEGRGTGLGLSICLGLLRSHGGELEIASKVWQGTRITVKLPVDAPVVKEPNGHV